MPESFVQYGEARKNGFLKAKKIKDEGGRIAGTFCAFTPSEILEAAGFFPVSLCGSSNETIPIAEETLPKNLCPLVKSSYGFAVSDKCPYTYFADLIVGETTCDGKKKMYELLGKLKEMYVLQLPQGIDRPYAKDMWTKELIRFKEFIEERFSLTITDEALREASKKRNRFRKAKCSMMELQKFNPAPVDGSTLYKFFEGAGFKFDLDTSISDMEAFVENTLAEYNSKPHAEKETKKRILITGCPIGGVAEKAIGAIEENGGIVVCFENCGGIKPTRNLVDSEAENIMEAIAEHYLTIGCSVMTPNIHRNNMFPGLLEEFNVDGVVDIILMACHTYNVETDTIRSICKENNVPYMSLETDFSQTDIGQMNTRIAAFIEML